MTSDNEQPQQSDGAGDAPRITKESLESRITSTKFLTPAENLTICIITLDNKFHVVGESACVNSANFNQKTGENNAKIDAFRKLWPLFGFNMAENNFAGVEGLKKAA